MRRRVLSSQDNAGLRPLIELLGSGSSGPPGVSGGDILWAPGLPSVGNRVATWAQVQTAIANAHGAITVFVDSTAAPAVVTAGTATDCSRVTFQGQPDAGVTPVMTIPDTAVLRNVLFLEGSLIVNCQAQTGANLTFANGDTLIVADFASIQLDATCTIPPVSGGLLGIVFKDGGFFNNALAAGVSLVHVLAGQIWQALGAVQPEQRSRVGRHLPGEHLHDGRGGSGVVDR